MATAFDDRIVRVGVEIEGEMLNYEGLRIEARGTKWRDAMMSQCSIIIYGLEREHRQYILTKASPISRPPAPLTPINVTLDVGRQSYGAFRLFEGAVFQGGVSQPPDIGLRLESLTNNFLMAQTVAVSLPEYSTIRQIAQQVANNLGATLQMNVQNPSRMVGNYAFTGSPVKQVEELNKLGVIAFVDNTTLVVVDPQQARGNNVVTINAANGMVGVPQPTESGCIVRVMIGRDIEVGGEVRVESEMNPAVNGEYIVMRMDFDLCNRADPFWYTLQLLNKQFYSGVL